MIEIVSERRYGEPKLTKPGELKGLKSIGSVPWSRAACPVFLTDSHIYIKHRDFFSPSCSTQKARELGLTFTQERRFVYPDAFGCVVLRCEAWLRLPLSCTQGREAWQIPHALCEDMARAVHLPDDSLENYDWLHFFEDLYRLCKPHASINSGCSSRMRRSLEVAPSGVRMPCSQ